MKIKVKTNYEKGPQTLSIKTKNDIKTIKNILLGEVWFGSGQSNMEMPLSGFRNEPVFGSQEIIAKSKNDLLKSSSTGFASSLKSKLNAISISSVTFKANSVIFSIRYTSRSEISNCK